MPPELNNPYAAINIQGIKDFDMARRKISDAFRKARREMRSRLIQCHDCIDYATELHHIVAVEDGGTDDLINLMPLCRMCHKEYTSSQTIERNQLWAEISIDDKGELSTRYKGEKSSTEKPIIFNSSRPTKFLIETKMGSIIRGVLLPDNPIEIISKGDIDKAEMNCGDGSSIKDILSIK